jgi:hypothetical protein
MNEAFMDRLFRLGGFATQYGHAADRFVTDWQRTRDVRPSTASLTAMAWT